MYVGKELAARVHPSTVMAANAALERRLTVYAGAGLSAAAPTSLPGAAGLASKIYHLLTTVVDFGEIDEWDLLAVSDRVEAEPRGLEILHAAIARVGNFDAARPNFAHHVLGLLICEGAATVLEANYDNCIERSALPEIVPVVISDTDRQQLGAAALLKVHGCISRPHTMLATTTELEAPPLYAVAELGARLSTGTVTFIGLGSPADYVQESVRLFVSRVSTASLTLVDPKLDDWDSSGWREVVPALEPASRITMGAEEFCDDVLRFYVTEIFRRVADAVSTLGADHDQRVGAEAVVQLFHARDAVWALQWLRRAAWQFKVGTPVVTSSRVLQGILAMSMLASGTPVRVFAGGMLWLSDLKLALMLLVSDHGPSGASTAVEAEHRVMDARSEGRLPDDSEVLVVCCGQSGSLGPDEAWLARGSRLLEQANPLEPGGHIIDSAEEGHLIDGIFRGPIRLIAGEGVIDIA
jgi:hypothetical protein